MSDTYSVVIRFTFEAEDVQDAGEMAYIIGEHAYEGLNLFDYEVVSVEGEHE